jgi:hypothetical protein
MTEQELSLLATKVVNDTKFWIGLVGVIGAVVGSVLTLTGNFAIEWFKGSKQRKIDGARQEILKEMLEDQAFQWRNLSTLAAVVGCNEEQTKDHLIAIGARGSEKNDGNWGLISRHSLSEIKRNDT